MTCWRKELQLEFDQYKDSWENVESYVPSDKKWLDYLFDDDTGETKGVKFTLWTKTRVYFPSLINGIEQVSSISRNPNNIATKHIGL